MTCPEERILAFLDGELTGTQARDFDAHLLTCESCWKAVQEDRAGRLALDLLRGAAPVGLADRVAMAVQLAGSTSEGPVVDPGIREHRPVATPSASSGAKRSGHAPTRSRRPALILAAAAAVAVVVAGGWWGARGSGPLEPPQVAAVLAAAQSMGRDHAPGRGPEIVAHDQLIAVWYYRVEGQSVLVATSEQQFPMPAHPMRLPGSTASDWMATKGRLGIYCANAPVGHESMLVVAAMPVAELPHVAADLHLL